MPYVLRLAPEGWNAKQIAHAEEDISYDENTVSSKAKRSAWARLIKKVYEVDPLICPKYQSKMHVMSVITDKVQVMRILRHLWKICRVPPGVELADLEGTG